MISTIVIFLSVIRLIRSEPTVSQLCDSTELIRHPIRCKLSLPCWFMVPILSDTFEENYKAEEETTGEHCDCIEGVCVQQSFKFGYETVANVPCRPESCVPPTDPLVQCRTDQTCSLAYPYIPIEFANDWWSDELTCKCGADRSCEATITVGVSSGENTTLTVPCRGIQLRL